MNDSYFVVVIPSFGATLIGTLDKTNFNNWVSHRATITLFEPKRLSVVVSETEPGNQNSRVNTLQIGPVHMGDTPEERLYIDQASVEIIGEIQDIGNGQCRCTSNDRLFQSYLNACKSWRMSRSNLVSPSTQDIANINKVLKR
jgi:hypothetical protein